MSAQASRLKWRYHSSAKNIENVPDLYVFTTELYFPSSVMLSKSLSHWQSSITIVICLHACICSLPLVKIFDGFADTLYYKRRIKRFGINTTLSLLPLRLLPSVSHPLHPLSDYLILALSLSSSCLARNRLQFYRYPHYSSLPVHFRLLSSHRNRVRHSFFTLNWQLGSHWGGCAKPLLFILLVQHHVPQFRHMSQPCLFRCKA